MPAQAPDDSGGPLSGGIIDHIPDSIQLESFKPNRLDGLFLDGSEYFLFLLFLNRGPRLIPEADYIGEKGIRFPMLGIKRDVLNLIRDISGTDGIRRGICLSM